MKSEIKCKELLTEDLRTISQSKKIEYILIERNSDAKFLLV